jgi:dihydrofolate synthase/folylpolyglutamate synthase
VNEPSGPFTPRAWLTGLELFGVKLGLSNIGALCEALGHPERCFPAVHIAGTNGKGSVAAMVDAALGAAGHRVGRYTSPHLMHLEERFVIGGTRAAPGELDRTLERVREATDSLIRAGTLDVHPTFFEVTTAAAFLMFAEAQVDVAVLEVGLGGRFDATNVVQPAISVITSIAFDHEQHLGHTLSAIAFEKAGIVKPGVPVVTGELPLDARAVVHRLCVERAAPWHEAVTECVIAYHRESGRTVLDLSTPRSAYPPIVLELRGDHQVGNAVVAVRALELLDASGLAVPTTAVVSGLATARWPARLELVDAGHGRELLVDGAHNPAGALALAAYVSSEWPHGLPLVFGAMRDKHVAAMLRSLAPLAHPLVVTTAPGSRAFSAATLASVAREEGLGDVRVHPDIACALEAAWEYGDRIAVAGSLYLAGRVLSLIGRS